MDNNGAARQTGWQPSLHWALVWIFALVLPWICWGAQATPGHPHLRAHFVFGTPPPLARNAQEAVHHAAMALANGRPEHCTTPSPSFSAGLSTPPVLAVTLLLLAILTAASLPPPCTRPGFRLRTAALYQSFPPPAAPQTTPTPAPRLMPTDVPTRRRQRFCPPLFFHSPKYQPRSEALTGLHSFC